MVAKPLGGTTGTVALHTPNILLLTGQLRLPKVTIFVYSTMSYLSFTTRQMDLSI